jgi:hypothetical protein
MEKVIELSIQIILFLIASYFIFYKNYLKSLGSEMAKLSTIEQLKTLEEKVKKSFNEEMELYKSKLSEELNLKIEPLKSELAKNNITYQIQYNFLHQERAKVTLEIYKRLLELHSSMATWTAKIHPILADAEKESEERRNRVNDAITNFRNYYLENKLFFPSDFCKYIDDLFEEYWNLGWDFGWSEARLKEQRLSAEYIKHYSEQMSKISNEVRDNLPKKIEEINTIFRKILNTEDTIEKV